MTTAFEFLPRTDRRIRIPRLSVIGFLGVTLVGAGVYVGLLQYARHLELEAIASSERVAGAMDGFITKAIGLLPAESLLAELEEKTRVYNLDMGGPASVWTLLFNTLEQVLPAEAVVTAVENPATGKPEFPAAERNFRIRLAVADTEAANALYRKLSELRSMESLNFAPKGEIRYQGRSGLSIELEFHFNPGK